MITDLFDLGRKLFPFTEKILRRISITTIAQLPYTDKGGDMHKFSIDNKVTWKFWAPLRRQLLNDYGHGPFYVAQIYDTDDPHAGHPQVLHLRSADGNLLQKNGHSPGAHFSGRFLKKIK